MVVSLPFFMFMAMVGCAWWWRRWTTTDARQKNGRVDFNLREIPAKTSGRMQSTRTSHMHLRQTDEWEIFYPIRLAVTQLPISIAMAFHEEHGGWRVNNGAPDSTL